MSVLCDGVVGWRGEAADSGVRSLTSLPCWCLTDRISRQQVVYLSPCVADGGDTTWPLAVTPCAGHLASACPCCRATRIGPSGWCAVCSHNSLPTVCATVISCMPDLPTHFAWFLSYFKATNRRCPALLFLPGHSCNLHDCQLYYEKPSLTDP